MQKVILFILMGLLISFKGSAEERMDPLERRIVKGCEACGGDEVCHIEYPNGSDSQIVYCVTAFRDPCALIAPFLRPECRVEYRIRVTIDRSEISLALPESPSRDYHLFVAPLTESVPQSLYFVTERSADEPQLTPLLSEDGGIYSSFYMGAMPGSKRLLLVRDDLDAAVLVAVVSTEHHW